MSRAFRSRFALTFLLLAALLGGVKPAKAQDYGEALAGFLGGTYDDTEAAINAVSATADPMAYTVIDALSDKRLFVSKQQSKVFYEDKTGALFDAASGQLAGEPKPDDLTAVRINNRLRRSIDAALGALSLMNPDAQTRLGAAEAVFKSSDASALAAVEKALAREDHARVRTVLEEARASIVLGMPDISDARKIAAIDILKRRGDQDALEVLGRVPQDAPAPVREAADKAMSAINSGLALWIGAQNAWYGISLGSVLLLAAIGLAITFGVMGVINMAHGEMVMIGAYVTFLVQSTVKDLAPGLTDWSLVFALPAAFVVAGAVGIAIERGIIRFLYGRPLETLLATWGVSLILQQAVRSLFGPTNQEVSAPSWMAGAFNVGHMAITYNRLWIVLFSLAVLAVLMIVMKKTPYGLQMRAVTQNRRMASAVGIRTDLVDALTFGLGSGIAGIAGVALSQIDNVSPNLGQSYIIDSFMVVVFGGVGNLWGTLVGAMSLGIANKFLEPFAGAVLGKILILVLIILFIQRRPRGLFALKGRAIEA